MVFDTYCYSEVILFYSVRYFNNEFSKTPVLLIGIFVVLPLRPDVR